MEIDLDELKINELISLKRLVKLKLKSCNITPTQEFEYLKMHKCLDCPRFVSRKAKRCWTCSIKNRDNSKMKDNLKVFHNEEHPRWKGDNVGYSALHKWIRQHKVKPWSCEDCNKNPPYDVANISSKYKRDIKDFKWLCRKCHYKRDRNV